MSKIYVSEGKCLQAGAVTLSLQVNSHTHSAALWIYSFKDFLRTCIAITMAGLSKEMLCECSECKFGKLRLARV